MTRLRKLLQQHKYKIGVFLMLSASSAMCIALVQVRIAHSGSQRYTIQVWNLFLAWIPFALAYVVHMLSWRRRLVYFVTPVFALVWLIFFPNAQYLLTDLEHLSQESTVAPLWYDVILLVWLTWTGMLLGIVSLNLMQDVVRRTFNRQIGWIFVFLVAGFSSVGVYIGRFMRLNSTDLFQDPAQDQLEEGLLAFEVAVEDAVREARRPADLRHGHGAVPVLGEEAHRGGHQALRRLRIAAALALHVPAPPIGLIV